MNKKNIIRYLKCFGVVILAASCLVGLSLLAEYSPIIFLMFLAAFIAFMLYKAGFFEK